MHPAPLSGGLTPSMMTPSLMTPNLMVTGSGRWPPDPSTLTSHPWMPRPGAPPVWLSSSPYSMWTHWKTFHLSALFCLIPFSACFWLWSHKSEHQPNTNTWLRRCLVIGGAEREVFFFFFLSVKYPATASRGQVPQTFLIFAGHSSLPPPPQSILLQK